MKRELTEVYCGRAKGENHPGAGTEPAGGCRGKECDHHPVPEGKERRSMDFLEEMDQMDIKIFRFEKQVCCYDELSEEEKAEERGNS